MTARDEQTRRETMPRAHASHPDTGCQIALMLCESLIHVLVEERILTKRKAMEAVETVAEVMRESAEAGGASAASRSAVALIERIARSFASNI